MAWENSRTARHPKKVQHQYYGAETHWHNEFADHFRHPLFRKKHDACAGRHKRHSKMLPYLVTIIVLIITSARNKKENQPPASLGKSYFREER